MESVLCNFCGAAATEPFAVVADLLLERLNVKTTLVRCRQCGLVYQNPRPTLAEMGEHYPPQYESYTDQTVQAKRNWFLQKAAQRGVNKRCSFVTKYRRAGNLLDIGCATGGFLLGMRNQGDWTLAGVEINPAVAALARERHGLDIFAGTLDKAGYPTASFDAVTLWGVFEHLHDPLQTLTEIRRILRPDGIVVISVPNLSSWNARLFGATWAGLDAPRHLYVFTPETLSALLTKAGFAVIEHSCTVGSYMAFVLDVRFWLTAHGVAARYKEVISQLLYHPFARLLSAPLFYLIGNTRRGPSLVTVARKVEPKPL